MALDAIWLWGSARVVSMSYMEMPHSAWRHDHALLQVATCVVNPQHSTRADNSRLHSLCLQTALLEGFSSTSPRWAPSPIFHHGSCKMSFAPTNRSSDFIRNAVTNLSGRQSSQQLQSKCIASKLLKQKENFRALGSSQLQVTHDKNCG